MAKVKAIVEKWFCPLCHTPYGAKTKICERCRCEKCGRHVPRDAHSCERDAK
jgi:RNA polymerase subunit RPABC4/transcription elongation factor Spt4